MHDCLAVDAELARVQAELARLGRENDALRRRVKELDALFHKTISALQASQAGSYAKPENRKKQRAEPGARPGHQPHNREPRPTDEERDATMSHCPDCGGRLGESVEVRARVVEDIVPARAKTTLVRVHRYWCSHCKTRVEAPVPDALPNQRFGLRLMLLVCYWRTLGLSWGKIRAQLRDVFGIHLSHGCLIGMERTIVDALGPAYEQLKEQLRREASVHADDTSWRIDGENHWLWIFLGKTVAVFTVANTRGRRAIQAELGDEYAGVVVTDLYPGFRGLPYANQKCLVHLLREIHRFERKPDFAPSREWKRVRMRVKRLVTEAVTGHQHLRNPAMRTALRARLVARTKTLPSVVRRHKYARTLAKTASQYAESLFTFLECAPGTVHWENNPAERGLRCMVVNRKTSFGSRSDGGARRRSVLQSVAETGRLRGGSFLTLAGAHVGLQNEFVMPER